MDRYNFDRTIADLLNLPPLTKGFELSYSAMGEAKVKVFHYKPDANGYNTGRLMKTVYTLFKDEQ